MYNRVGDEIYTISALEPQLNGDGITYRAENNANKNKSKQAIICVIDAHASGLPV